MRLIIATRNKGKLREIKHILDGRNLQIVFLSQLKKNFRIKEDGVTFLENALKKAMSVSRAYPDDLVAGEDSGLEVEYLGGKPGIFSKRYSGKGATDLKKRRARFRCVIALAKNGKLIKDFEGKIEGIINKEMKGESGFGYDPVFYLPHYKKTVAQFPLSKKNKISHRARAFRKLRNYLNKIN